MKVNKNDSTELALKSVTAYFEKQDKNYFDEYSTSKKEVLNDIIFLTLVAVELEAESKNNNDNFDELVRTVCNKEMKESWDGEVVASDEEHFGFWW